MNWFSANLQVASALAEAGYDHRLVLGDGGHDRTMAEPSFPMHCAGYGGKGRARPA